MPATATADVESQLLGTVDSLRREISEAVDESRTLYESDREWNEDEVIYDIVQPGPPLERDEKWVIEPSWSEPVEAPPEEVAPPSEVVPDWELNPEAELTCCRTRPVPLADSRTPMAECPLPEPARDETQPPEDAHPVRRFELLFTRLRRRREQIQARQCR
jgi:hypothetical protein